MVVRSSRSGYGPLNLVLFDLGIVPWAGLSRGRATGTSFGSLCHFRIILGSFWDDFRIILGGPWGVPGESLGAPWGVPGGAQGSPAPVRHRDPQKVSKVETVVKTSSRHIPPAGRGTRFWDHPGMPYLSLLEPIVVGALPEGTGLRNPGAEILKITKNHKERKVPSIMAFRCESGRWNTDSPYGPSVRTVRTDRPYGRLSLIHI